MTTFPRVLIFVRPVFHIAEYCEPASLPVSNVNFTSAAVNGLPSFHFTPLRTVTTWFLPTHLLRRGEPGNEAVLQRVVAEERLVQETDEARVVVRPQRVEVRVWPPLLARRVQRLRARESERRLLSGTRAARRERGERRRWRRSPRRRRQPLSYGLTSLSTPSSSLRPPRPGAGADAYDDPMGQRLAVTASRLLRLGIRAIERTAELHHLSG